MGGRITSIAGINGDNTTFYIASASGGLYKTTDAGTTYEPIFTDQPVLSMGAISVSQTNPDVVYVGTGEGNPRNTTSFGNGVYKSVDGGENWIHLGLDDTERISEIRIHPENPDIVFVAAMGHEWGPNEQRGVFKTTDGGESWEKVLYVNETTGASGIDFDSENPEIIYAGMYDYMRKPWHFRSGGPGSGLYKSSDGGETWVELTADAPGNGLPEGLLGRTDVKVAPNNPYVVYAMIESEVNGELWRSDDRGKTWRMVSDNPEINDRPFYFTDIRINPADPNLIYALSGGFYISEDGGKTWDRGAEDVHGDFQAMWIDPMQPDRHILGSDGGVFVSHDGGKEYDFHDNVVYAQAYHINYDMRTPYRVYGGFQDNGVWYGPSEKWNNSGIRNRDWKRIRGGDGYYAEVDPRDWTRIFANSHYGDIGRFDGKTGESQFIKPYPPDLGGSAAGDHPYRFNWNSPIHMSHNNPDRVYFGSNVLFKTTDDGRTWEEISPDLTKEIEEEQRSSGGITTDNTSAEYHNAILTIDESVVNEDVIWVGTDDGNLQVTQNAGDSWNNVVSNVEGVPEHTWIPWVDASNHEEGTAYVVFDRHRQNDFSPMVYRTDDFGESWTDITSNLPDKGYAHVIKDDPNNPNVLYLGTELGIYVSFDRGEKWVSLRQGLPPVAVRDLFVHPRDNDLGIATHGEGYQIMDDVTALQQLPEAKENGVHLFDLTETIRHETYNDYIETAQGQYIGENPPSGAAITYYLEAGKNKNVSIEILQDGQVIRTLDAESKPGVNRVYWDLREESISSASLGYEVAPRVIPGEYTVRLSAGSQSMTKPLTVQLDPRKDVSDQALQEQYETVKQLSQIAAEGEELVADIDRIRNQLKDRMQRTDGELKKQVREAAGEAKRIRDLLIADPGGYRSPAMLLDKVEELAEAIDEASNRPTKVQLEWVNNFEEDLNEVSASYRQFDTKFLQPLNKALTASGYKNIQ